MTGERRYLIVNADDLGRSSGINAGVYESHARGIVTSASLMVRWPDAGEAAEWARTEPRVSVGLHLDLGEWLYEDNEWGVTYEVVPLDDADAVEEEVRRQLEMFRDLTGRFPTHLDSHQHVHRAGPATFVAENIATELGVPLRDRSPLVRHCGSFYGQTSDGRPLPEVISVANLIDILSDLPPGVTELACHPGRDGTPPYASERAREVAVLCDPRLRAFLAEERILLRSFHDVGSS